MDEDDLKGRLASAWQGGTLAEACGILVDEVRERRIPWLVNQFRPRLSEEEAEDCFSYATERLLKRSDRRDSIRDPYNYVLTCAKNEALDVLEEKACFPRVDPGWLSDAGGDPVDPDDGQNPGWHRWQTGADLENG